MKSVLRENFMVRQLRKNVYLLTKIVFLKYASMNCIQIPATFQTPKYNFYGYRTHPQLNEMNHDCGTVNHGESSENKS